MGVQIINAVKKGTILGLYLNHSNIHRVTGSRIRNPSNHSVYAVDFEGLARDAYDPATGSVSCTVARFNDPLDSTLDNAEFYVHPLRPHILTVRASKDIQGGEFGYLPYGAPYWCDPAYSLDPLAQAVRRYFIDIHTSTEATDGDWRALPQYTQLSDLPTHVLHIHRHKARQMPVSLFNILTALSAHSTYLIRYPPRPGFSGRYLPSRTTGSIQLPRTTSTPHLLTRQRTAAGIDTITID
jgi:hypothetical protein